MLTEYTIGSTTFAVMIPRDESGNLIVELEDEEFRAIKKSIISTGETLKEAGWPEPNNKSISIKNEINGEEKEIIPIIIGYPRNPDSNSMTTSNDMLGNNAAIGVCQIDEVEHDGKMVKLEAGTEVIALPSEDRAKFTELVVSHELVHVWQNNLIEKFSDDDPRSKIPYDIEAFAAWWGLRSGFVNSETALPREYLWIMMDNTLEKTQQIEIGQDFNSSTLIDINGQGDYGAYMWWEGLWGYMNKNTTLTDSEKLVKMAEIHLKVSQNLFELTRTPSPISNEQAMKQLGINIYNSVIESELGLTNGYNQIQIEAIEQVLNDSEFDELEEVRVTQIEQNGTVLIERRGFHQLVDHQNVIEVTYEGNFAVLISHPNSPSELIFAENGYLDIAELSFPDDVSVFVISS